MDVVRAEARTQSSERVQRLRRELIDEVIIM